MYPTPMDRPPGAWQSPMGWTPAAGLAIVIVTQSHNGSRSSQIDMHASERA